jgi:hypothetical protein
MKETGWIGGAVAATIVMVPSIAMACSAAMQAHNAMMHGKPPDCYDRNTLAIYGPRALTDGKPPAAWLAVEPQQVVLGKTEAADRCFGLQTGMRAMPIVTMQPVE